MGEYNFSDFLSRIIRIGGIRGAMLQRREDVSSGSGENLVINLLGVAGSNTTESSYEEGIPESLNCVWRSTKPKKQTMLCDDPDGFPEKENALTTKKDERKVKGREVEGREAG